MAGGYTDRHLKVLLHAHTHFVERLLGVHIGNSCSYFYEAKAAVEAFDRIVQAHPESFHHSEKHRSSFITLCVYAQQGYALITSDASFLSLLSSPQSAV